MTGGDDAARNKWTKSVPAGAPGYLTKHPRPAVPQFRDPLLNCVLPQPGIIAAT